MLPVAWPGRTVQALPLPAGATQGTALAVASRLGPERIAILHRYVGGATGTTSPLPTFWRDGVLAAWDRTALLPPDHDAGMVTSIAVTDQYVLAAGVVHRTGSSPPAYSGIVWLFDLTFAVSTWSFLPLPTEPGEASFGPWVSMVIEGDTVWSAAAVQGAAGAPKPVVWKDDAPGLWFGLEFGAAPWASPTGLSMVELVPYSSGWVRPTSTGGPPQPAIWAGSILDILPAADPSNPIGAGEAIAIHLEGAYVSGESLAGDPSSPSRRLAVPAIWSNGARTDLGTLSAPGAGPAISGPLFGWWRLPGTPGTSPPDWPYPGGTGEVLGSLPVSAAGSGVARTVVAVPPSP